MKMIGAGASQVNLRFHCQILTLIRLGLLHSGSFGVVHVLWEISSVYASKFREISPKLVLVPGAYSKQKGGNKLIALPVLRTREVLKFIETKI